MPHAENVEGAGGITTRGMPSSRAIATAWSGPAPPYAIFVARDRSHAGAHFLDIDHRDPELPPVDRILVGRADHPALDDRALRRRPTHVERDQLWNAERLGQHRAPDRAGRGTGLDR